ncbi:DUF732 domain-containing protein [Actinokineospora spheciospongiae]|uniref:DUF732 domain-containing protein n=1 Tax=Actinokineospora spheciospongiae TaxID=909613 RepID=UPI000D716A5B|nr:DUF732 domain-containing protein [Actinokineospora spheciospongiae]PWW50254.1 uncharacterized protein DUF732 [Actinokineospora spheciospongiae]
MHIRRVAVALAALLVAAVPAASTATAAAPTGEAGYLAAQRWVQRSGYWGSDRNIDDRSILSFGYTACELLARGLDEHQAARTMYPFNLPDWSEGYRTAVQGVRAAHRNICPQY